MRRLVFALALIGVVGALGTGPAIATPPPAGNSIVIGSTVLPAYPVVGSPTVSAVAFRLSGGQLTAYNESGTQLWAVSTSGTDLFGGFDFNADGWPDPGVRITTATSQLCGGAVVMNETTLHFFSGQTGTLYTPVAPLLDKCWQFPGTPAYTTAQWTSGTPLWGAGTNQLFLSPYYADTGWYFGFSGGQFTSDGALYYPSISAYDATYTADQPNAWGTGTSYVANSHVANGLITTVSSQKRLVFWTSGRVLQYKISALASDQLLFDKPYLTNGDTSLGGRNYGLTAVDPNVPSRIAMIGGTATAAVWTDLKNGTLGSDGCGGIERHVSLYDAAANTIGDRFYAKAPDTCASNPSQSSNYSNYVVFPPNPWVKRGAGLRSRLAYNVYGTDGRWHLHITNAASNTDVTDLYALIDVFLWDIRDVDGDGVEDWLISTTGSTPGSYFPNRWTGLYHWDESTLTLPFVKSYANLVPWLESSFKTATVSNTSRFSGLYPSLYTFQSGARKLVMMNTSNMMTLVNP